jgi:hypothetical protein
VLLLLFAPRGQVSPESEEPAEPPGAALAALPPGSELKQPNNPHRPPAEQLPVPSSAPEAEQSRETTAATSPEPLLVAPAPVEPLAPERAEPALVREEKNPRLQPLQRLSKRDEADLLKEVAAMPEVGLNQDGLAVVLAYRAHISPRVNPAAPVATTVSPLTDAAPLLRVRPDFKSLPLHAGAKSQLPPKSALNLESLSRKLRLYLGQVLTQPGPEKLGAEILGKALRNELKGTQAEWLRPEAIPTLMQMLMHEQAGVRLVLVELLAEIPGQRATEALARRAVFDFSPRVREAAIRALQARPGEYYRPVLLQALRYPWAPPAEHAAEALVSLNDRPSIPELVMLLEEIDPCAPHTLSSGLRTVKEVVRVNHVNNCLACHPPANGPGEPCLGVDPVVTVPTRMTQAQLNALQRLTSVGGGHNYGGRSITGGGTGTTATSTARQNNRLVTVPIPALIRGDITFVRQDFSVQLPRVAQPGNPPGVPGFPVNPPQPPAPPIAANGLPNAPAPTGTRFDFMVRSRVLTSKEAAPGRAVETRYPQREAVLFALRHLTRQDEGDTTAGWMRRFPHAAIDRQALRRLPELTRANPSERGVLLVTWRDTVGELNTRTLALAVRDLRGPVQEQARAALLDRLARLEPAELARRLKDPEPTLRQAAVVAGVRNRVDDLVPDLVPLLDDPDRSLAEQARTALVDLTGQKWTDSSAWKDWLRGSWSRKAIREE